MMLPVTIQKHYRCHGSSSGRPAADDITTGMFIYHSVAVMEMRRNFGRKTFGVGAGRSRNMRWMSLTTGKSLTSKGIGSTVLAGRWKTSHIGWKITGSCWCRCWQISLPALNFLPITWFKSYRSSIKLTNTQMEVSVKLFNLKMISMMLFAVFLKTRCAIYLSILTKFHFRNLSASHKIPGSTFCFQFVYVNGNCKKTKR